MSSPSRQTRWREVAAAGHGGDRAAAAAALDDADPVVRELAVGAADRLGILDDARLVVALVDPDPVVRRRAVEVAATRPGIDLLGPLHDDDPTVVEHAAWACGEHVEVSEAVLARLLVLAEQSEAALIRESAVAALGALGDPRGLPAILHGCRDLPAVRRRAVLALAPFDGPEVDTALTAALEDRDWQVRQAAEDLRRAAGEP